MSVERRFQWATELGLLPDNDQREGESGAAFELRTGGLRRAFEALDAGRMIRMLGWTADFVRAYERRPLFRELAYIGDIGNGRWNAETLEMVSEFMRRAGSKKRGVEGQLLAADGIQSSVAMMRKVRELGTRCAVADTSIFVGTSERFKSMRREDGAPGERDTRRAFRAMHFARLAEQGWDRTSPVGEVEWAAGLTGHNAVLRGGEVGRRESHAFDAELGLTFRSITWCLPCMESCGRLWLILWVVPIKDQSARRMQAIPIPIVRRQVGGERGTDALCTYDAILAVWLRMIGAMPASAQVDWHSRAGSAGRLPANHPMAKRPMFALPDGRAMDTGHVRGMVQRMASACGEDPNEFGAKSLRAGGATDLREAIDDDAASMATIKQRGRWQSDIARIYQRALLKTQLDASAAMGRARGVDMEAICLGWSQPTSF